MKPSIASSCGFSWAASSKYRSARPSLGSTSKITAIIDHSLLALSRRHWLRRQLERPGHHLGERALLAQDKALRARELEILAALAVGLDAATVRLVGGEGIEREQAPRHVVAALMRQEITDQMAAAARDHAAPRLGVARKRVALERV